LKQWQMAEFKAMADGSMPDGSMPDGSIGVS
jgi:hypothetical protein